MKLLQYIDTILTTIAFGLVVFIYWYRIPDLKHWYVLHDRFKDFYCFAATCAWCIARYRIMKALPIKSNKIILFISGMFTLVTAWNAKDMIIGNPYVMSNSEVFFGLLILFITIYLFIYANKRP